MDIRRKDEGQGTESQPEEKKPKKKQKQGGGSGAMGTILIIIILVALVAVGFYLARGDSDGTQVQDGAVATVNGQEISSERLQEQLDSFRNSTGTQAEQFNNLSETRQQEILLEGIINTELQLQAAEGAGVTVSDEEVESELQASIEQIGEEEFQNRLEQNGITREEVRDDLRDQMIISAYIEQEAGGEISATDEEIQQLYQQFTAQSQQTGNEDAEVPSLDELRPQIEQAVVQQKQQEIALQLLDQARENADIEVMIEGVEYPATSAEQEAPSPTGGTQQPVTQPSEESEIDAETEAGAEEEAPVAE